MWWVWKRFFHVAHIIRHQRIQSVEESFWMSWVWKSFFSYVTPNHRSKYPHRRKLMNSLCILKPLLTKQVSFDIRKSIQDKKYTNVLGWKSCCKQSSFVKHQNSHRKAWMYYMCVKIHPNILSTVQSIHALVISIFKETGKHTALTVKSFFWSQSLAESRTSALQKM